MYTTAEREDAARTKRRHAPTAPSDIAQAGIQMSCHLFPAASATFDDAAAAEKPSSVRPDTAMVCCHKRGRFARVKVPVPSIHMLEYSQACSSFLKRTVCTDLRYMQSGLAGHFPSKHGTRRPDSERGGSQLAFRGSEYRSPLWRPAAECDVTIRGSSPECNAHCRLEKPDGPLFPWA